VHGKSAEIFSSPPHLGRVYFSALGYQVGFDAIGSVPPPEAQRRFYMARGVFLKK
jgi:hypothetical protein